MRSIYQIVRMNADPAFRALVDRYGWRAAKRLQLYEKAIRWYERALCGWERHGMIARHMTTANQQKALTASTTAARNARVRAESEEASRG